nr:F-box/kelch-repeat protein At1g57790-like [Quercus suber]
MLKLIAKRLILLDYLHFRATCKMFHSIAPQIQWRIATPRLENPSLSPWLVLFGKESVYSFIDPNHGDKYLINLPQVLKEGSIIRSSKDGWLLVTVRMSTFFFNPFTQALLTLADRSSYIRNPCMGFSSTPDSSECVAVEIEDKTDNNSNFFVNFCSPGNEDWDVWEFEYTNFSFDCNSPVFYKGAFYYLGKEGNLGILKLNDEEHSFEVLTKPKPPCNGNFQKFLVECNGELLSIFVAPFGNPKTYLCKRCGTYYETWEELTACANRHLSTIFRGGNNGQRGDGGPGAGGGGNTGQGGGDAGGGNN